MPDLPRLMVFCKAPIPGQVKTRLVPAIGEAGACRVHEHLAHRTLEEVLQVRDNFQVELWCSPATEHPFFDRWPFTRYGQQGDDLGARMAYAFRQQAVPGLLVGCDLVNLTASYLLAAGRSLEQRDAVIGPAADGGYGLLGLQQFDNLPFENMPWGTEAVCSQTCAAFDTLGWRYEKLPELRDVDTPQDLVLIDDLEIESNR